MRRVLKFISGRREWFCISIVVAFLKISLLCGEKYPSGPQETNGTWCWPQQIDCLSISKSGKLLWVRLSALWFIFFFTPTPRLALYCSARACTVLSSLALCILVFLTHLSLPFPDRDTQPRVADGVELSSSQSADHWNCSRNACNLCSNLILDTPLHQRPIFISSHDHYVWLCF